MFATVMDQQQTDYQRQWPMSSPGGVTFQQQFPAHICTTTVSGAPSSTKRSRSCSEESSAACSSTNCGNIVTDPIARSSPSPSSVSSLVPVSSTPKKSRPNNYFAPRSIKPSVLTAMGTLSGASNGSNGIQQDSSSSVPMRRRLSGGQIDQYIFGEQHGRSGPDTDPNRPRSMSF